eukprot:TRINITY_DN25440_c0_g1_i1.p1 TRINITY_DN25440_c0_g1~~TRINITY_DN25440_c0_g1_i1.p1  ORF type:complete len:388 (-),score=31.53 TRINITY_DN25440_c0_g1_i1:472-1461(-)
MTRYGQDAGLTVEGPPERYEKLSVSYCSLEAELGMLVGKMSEADCKKECSRRPDCFFAQMEASECMLLRDCGKELPSAATTYVLRRAPCSSYTTSSACPWVCAWNGSQCLPKCSAQDGLSLSLRYPCFCGGSVCIANSYCTALSNSCSEKRWIELALPDKDKEDSARYRSCQAVGSKVVAVPFASKTILSVETVNNSWSMLYGYSDRTEGKYWTSAVLGNRVIAAPYNAERVLVIDVSEGRWSYLTGYADASIKKYRASVTVGSKVIAVPFSSPRVLVIGADNSYSFFPGYSDGAYDKYAMTMILPTSIGAAQSLVARLLLCLAMPMVS